MKKTLLEIVKDLLSATDSQDVNSLSDTEEATQFARVVEETFYDIIAPRLIPEHNSLIKLTPLSDTDFPTHFVLEDNQAKISDVWYDVSSDGSYEYKRIFYEEPLDFLARVDRRGSAYQNVEDKSAGTNLRIYNDRQPSYFTSFDDKHFIFDAFDSSVENTLQQSKTRALGTTHPDFTISDDFTPDIDAVMFPYLVQEAKSRVFAMYKGSINPKVEQAARRQKVHVQNDKYRTRAPNNKRSYGRR